MAEKALGRRRRFCRMVLFDPKRGAAGRKMCQKNRPTVEQMKIVRYGTAKCWKYGFLCVKRGDTGKDPRFENLIHITAQIGGVEHCGEICYHVDKNSLELEVVYDCDIKAWREYFTGIPVKATRSSVYVDFDIDEGNPYHDEIEIFDLKECEASEFAEQISKYSEEQIRNKVQRIHEFEADAAEWKRETDAEAEDLHKYRIVATRVTEIDRQIAKNFGKYGKTKDNYVGLSG